MGLLNIYKCHGGTAIPVECEQHGSCEGCKYKNTLWYHRYRKAQMDLTMPQAELYSLLRKIKAEDRLKELNRRLRTLDLHKRSNWITVNRYRKEIEGLEKEVKQQ